jgi:hypothetical protein
MKAPRNLYSELSPSQTTAQWREVAVSRGKWRDRKSWGKMIIRVVLRKQESFHCHRNSGILTRPNVALCRGKTDNECGLLFYCSYRKLSGATEVRRLLFYEKTKDLSVFRVDDFTVFYYIRCVHHLVTCGNRLLHSVLLSGASRPTVARPLERRTLCFSALGGGQIGD